MSIGTILLIVLVLALAGVLPTWVTAANITQLSLAKTNIAPHTSLHFRR